MKVSLAYAAALCAPIIIHYLPKKLEQHLRQRLIRVVSLERVSFARVLAAHPIYYPSPYDIQY